MVSSLEGSRVRACWLLAAEPSQVRLAPDGRLRMTYPRGKGAEGQWKGIDDGEKERRIGASCDSDGIGSWYRCSLRA